MCVGVFVCVCVCVCVCGCVCVCVCERVISQLISLSSTLSPSRSRLLFHSLSLFLSAPPPPPPYLQSPPSQLGLIPLLQKLHGCVSQLEQFAVRVNDMPGRRYIWYCIYTPHTFLLTNTLNDTHTHTHTHTHTDTHTHTHTISSVFFD